MQLVEEIREMPTSYFEAKPQRAVGFDEVATAIIPDNASDELKTMLTNNGVKFVEYENGNEQSRMDILRHLLWLILPSLKQKIPQSLPLFPQC
jgi:hypothetical protein